jgi:hypothetical protein
MSALPEYYVYVYYDPRNGDPIYVGLGKKGRAFVHWKKKANNVFFQNVLDKVRVLGLTPRIEFVAIELFPKDAKRLEQELIALYGRRDLGLGTLCNLTDGGDGAIGHIRSQRAKDSTKQGILDYWSSVDRKAHGRKISQVFSARTPEELAVVGANISKSKTAEVRKKTSESGKLRKLSKEVQDKIVANSHTPDANAKRRESLKEIWKDTAKREKRRLASLELGKDPEYREKLSQTAKLFWEKRKASPAYQLRGFMPAKES